MDAVISIMIIAVMIALYFVPGIVATARNTNNFGAVMVVNVFLGWTLIGWVVALALAVSGSKKPKPNPWAVQ